jgi:hypothetical protein
MQSAQGEPERRDVHLAEALGGAAEGSYEQEAAVVKSEGGRGDGTRG